MDSYPLLLWSVFESGSIRTNNHVEGWHNRIKKIVVKAHPKEQALTEVTMAQLAAGAAPSHHARKVIHRDRKIDELKRRFLSNSITQEYLSGVPAHTNL